MTFLGIWFFIFGLLSILIIRKSFILVLVIIEILLLGASSVLIGYSFLLDQIEGQHFSLFVLAAAAAESATGLAILVQFYRVRGRVDYDVYFFLKG